MNASAFGYRPAGDARKLALLAFLSMLLLGLGLPSAAADHSEGTGGSYLEEEFGTVPKSQAGQAVSGQSSIPWVLSLAGTVLLISTSRFRSAIFSISTKRFRGGFARTVFPFSLILLVASGSVLMIFPTAVATQSAPPSIDGQWYKGDLHKHTWLFGGKRDLGDIVYNYKQLGYNFLFQGDHDYGKLNGYNFTETLDVTTGGLVKMVGDEWDRSPDEVPSSPCSTSAGVVERSSARAKTGTYSMHLSLTTSSLTCNGYWWDTTYHDETVSFARQNTLLNFSVYPTQFTPDKSGFAVHMFINVRSRPYDITLGNDATVPTNIGGLDDGKVEFSVYYGIPPYANSTFKKAVRLSEPTLNEWNTYSLDLSSMIPAAFGFDFHPTAGPYTVSIRAYSSGSFRSEFFLDDFFLYNHNGLSFKELQAWKNSIIHTWDTANFKTFPSIEFSYLHHINYHLFNYTDPAKMVFSNELVPAGSKNSAFTQLIVDYVQRQGVPAELNHPLTGSDPTPYMGWGTDVMDIMSSTREVGGLDVTDQNKVLAMWDYFLSNGAWILGVAASDSGTVGTSSFMERAPAVYIYAEELEALSLLKSMFEGRVFFGRQTYAGPLIFNTAPATEPYPSRYTRFIPDQGSTTTVGLYLKAGGMSSNWEVRWIRNGTVIATDSVGDGTFEAQRIFEVPDNANYFRIEIRDKSSACLDCLVAGTNPILFQKVPNLPQRTALFLSNVVTSTDLNYTRPSISGLNLVSFAGSSISFQVGVPGGARSTIYLQTSLTPSDVTGAESWTYDSEIDLLTVTTLGPSLVSVELSSGEPVPLGSVAVTPDSANVSRNGSIQFQAIAYDSNGDPVYGITFTWGTSVPGATIDSTGKFTAGETTGLFVDGVSATADGISGFADVQVLESTPASLILRPIGPGSRTEWSKMSACSANWICVSETTPDNDVTYVRTATPGRTDLYSFETVSALIPAGSTIEWVEVTLFARMSCSTGGTVNISLSSEGLTVGGDTISLNSEKDPYPQYEQRWLTSPFSGSAWTLSELDSLEAGQTFLSGCQSARVTNLTFEIRYVTP